MTEYTLTVSEVAELAGCHRLTVLAYEKRGFIKPMRNIQNHRRFREQDALKLKQILEIRRPLEK